MEPYSKGNRRILFGVGLIGIGGVWILEQLGIIPHVLRDVLISWQMILIVIGIFSLFSGNETSGWILIFIGGFFLVPHVFEIPWELRRLAWPVLLVSIGVLMLVRHQRKPKGFLADKNARELDYFDDFVVFGGREIVINSQNLIGGKSTSIFGGSEYDMRVARLSDNGAVVDCVSVFGGTGFKIPPDWAVKNEVSTIFGAFTDKRGNVITDSENLSKTLIIRGFTAFGGVEIKNY
jgi:predicted membrane protein